MFTLKYKSPSEYTILEHSNSRNVDANYPDYLSFITNGGIPAIELEGSEAEYMEIINNTVQYKENYETIKLANKKIEAKNTVYNNRVNRELGGFTVNGISLYTDKDSQALLSNAYLAAKNGLLEDGTLWKVSNGEFITITKEQIISLYESVIVFIKQGYELEKSKTILINNCTTLEDLNAIDLSII